MTDGHISVGNVHLDADQLTLRYLGQPIFLTTIEFGILLLLVQNMEVFISNTELCRMVGVSGATPSKTIHSHVYNLRKKLSIVEEHEFRILTSGDRYAASVT
jgi:DNA-binding response OmpR family regulator